jgi:signal transduction histidine kinase
MAHDLRNVLSGIIGAVELHRAGIGGEDDSLLHAALHRALEGVAILNGWREHVSLDEGPAAPTADLGSAGQSVVNALTSALATSGLTPGLRIEASLTPMRVAASGGELRRALVAVVCNAVNAAPAGLILVRNELRKGRACLDVVDEGSGMAEETRRRAKEPFYTEWGGGRRGMGLAIADGVAKRYHGSLALRTAEPTGTLVTLSLPAIDGS